MTRVELIDLLWGEHPPARAKATLQSYVLRLRRLLGPRCNGDAEAGGALQTQSPGYLLRLDPTGLDLYRSRALSTPATTRYGTATQREP